jgi:hypothetical protein
MCYFVNKIIFFVYTYIIMFFFTFCVDIQKHSKRDLLYCLSILLKSIHNNISNYNLICYTNFNININKYYFSNFNIEFRNYYDNMKYKIYSSKWLNLSFNKINIYKDLYDEFNRDYIWIDLDTLITYDISYINDLSNCFIENGGNCTNKNVLFTNNNNINIPRNRYIQGNFWKLNINLYNDLMITFSEIKKQKLILRYDLQDLFNYYIYIKNKGLLNNVYILGLNQKSETINGLSIWSKQGNTHANIEGLNNLYYENNKLKSNFYINKEIHILSFTFNTIKTLYKNSKFNNLLNP